MAMGIGETTAIRTCLRCRVYKIPLNSPVITMERQFATNLRPPLLRSMFERLSLRLLKAQTSRFLNTSLDPLRKLAETISLFLLGKEH